MKFRQCYTDVTKVTVHSQYANFTNQLLQCYSVTVHPRANFTNQMLQCYSVTAHPRAKNLKIS